KRDKPVDTYVNHEAQHERRKDQEKRGVEVQSDSTPRMDTEGLRRRLSGFARRIKARERTRERRSARDSAFLAMRGTRDGSAPSRGAGCRSLQRCTMVRV